MITIASLELVHPDCTGASQGLQDAHPVGHANGNPCYTALHEGSQ